MGAPAVAHSRVAFAIGILVAARVRAQWALSRHSLPRALELLTPVGPRLRLDGPEIARVIRVGESLCARAGLVNTCLYRALSRYLLLRLLGIEAEFVIGLNERIGGDEAHAWIEVDGSAFLENAQPAYVVMYRHPSDG